MRKRFCLVPGLHESLSSAVDTFVTSAIKKNRALLITVSRPYFNGRQFMECHVI